MLAQNERCGRVVWDLLEDIPRSLIEDLYPIGCLLGAHCGALLSAFFALDPEADKRADHAAELDRLLLAQVAEVLHLDLSVCILVNGKRVYHSPVGGGAPSRALVFAATR